MLIIFTDLDGSLLNHHDYSFREAWPSLDRIKRMDIPLIITTSKTRKEVEILREEMELKEPFIVENGGGVYFPYGYREFTIETGAPAPPYVLITLGKPYVEIRAFVEKIKDPLGIRGIGDLSVPEIAALADLTIEGASLAKEREFSEPFIMKNEKLIGKLEYFASREGIKITKGGRFRHLIGLRQDKGKAVEIVKDIFIRNSGSVISIGVGDSENDLPMLRNVDIPVLIPHPGGGYEKFEATGLIRAQHPGSRGWNEAMERLLDDIERKYN